MSGTDSDAASEGTEHAYFQAVEEAFIRLRGAPFLLSPEDWRVAGAWREAGIPLDLVERVLERVLRQREEAESGRARRIRSLRYFDSAMGAAWKSLRSVAGSEAARDAEPLEVGPRLQALADALPLEVAGRPALVEKITALRGATPKVEEALARLDREMVDTVRESLSEESGTDLERRVEAGLERVGDRLAGDELAAARARLEAQILRRLFDLPLLSLFSPQARAEQGG